MERGTSPPTRKKKDISEEAGERVQMRDSEMSATTVCNTPASAADTQERWTALQAERWISISRKWSQVLQPGGSFLLCREWERGGHLEGYCSSLSDAGGGRDVPVETFATRWAGISC